MTIKSLLLGSAAVLVAVSGARAADAIVVEPEPVEYVRVCDAYGSGWFYIPGTETCMKIDGDVRVQYDVRHYHDDVDDETSLHDADARGRFNIRAQNETEYGPLTSRIRMYGTASADKGTEPGEGHNDVLSDEEGPSSGGVVVDKAFISIAGFTFGFDDTYWSRAGNYGFYQARFDGTYQFDNAIFIEYTYAANGFAATIGAQDGNTTGEAGAPDVYAGLTYSSGGFYLAGMYVNDASEGAGAWKVRVDYDFGNGWAFGGWYTADDGETDYAKGHIWGVTGKWQFTDNMQIFAGTGYWDEYADDGDSNNQSQYYTTVGLAWDIVPGLLIQPEYNWVSYSEDFDGEQDNFGRFSLRVVRSF